MPPIEETSTELQERLQKLQDQLAAIPKTEEGIHDSLKASVLLDLGKAQIEAGNFDTALGHLGESVNLTNESSLERAAAQVEISTAYMGLSQLEEAENAIHTALQTYLLKQEKKGLHKANRQLALIYAQQGRLEDAQNILQKSIDQTIAAEEWEELGKFYGFAGELATAQQNFQVAFEHFRSGVKALKQTDGNYERIGSYYEAIARLLMKFGKTEEAASSFEEGANQYALAEKPLLQGGLLVLTAKIWEGEGQYLKSASYLEKGATILQTSEEESAAMQTADAYHQAGYMQEQDKQWKDALQNYQLALPFAQQTKDEMFIASIEDSIEQCEEKLEANPTAASSNDRAEKKGFFGKLKGIFGGK